MRKSAHAYTCLFLSGLGLAVAALSGAHAAADGADAYIAAATATAGDDQKGILNLCVPSATEMAPAPISAEPAKVFDNLYFLGTPWVSAWAVTTPAGIILIDALDSEKDAQTYIEGGLKKLKLDPHHIKDIIVTHAYVGRMGGVQYLAEKFHPTFIMSDLDWGMFAAQMPARAPALKRGKEVRDGDTLTLGGTTIEFYATPPDTAGTLSLILPLKDGETAHVGAEWGGAAFNFPPTEENFTAYISSAQKFSKVARDRGADVPLSNRSVFDEAFKKITALKSRQPGDPHPFVMGPGSAEKYLAVAAECAMAARARIRAANQ